MSFNLETKRKASPPHSSVFQPIGDCSFCHAEFRCSTRTREHVVSGGLDVSFYFISEIPLCSRCLLCRFYFCSASVVSFYCFFFHRETVFRSRQRFLLTYFCTPVLYVFAWVNAGAKLLRKACFFITLSTSFRAQEAKAVRANNFRFLARRPQREEGKGRNDF